MLTHHSVGGFGCLALDWFCCLFWFVFFSG